MRMVLTAGGISTFVNKFESQWLDTHTSEEVHSKDLSERDQRIAEQLSHKGILDSYGDKFGRPVYSRNINDLK